MDNSRFEKPHNSVNRGFYLVCASCGSPSKYEYDQCPICGSNLKKWVKYDENAHLKPPQVLQADEKVTLPESWIGLLFIITYYLGYLGGMINSNYLLISSFSRVGGGIYWLFYIYKLHKVLDAVSYNKYPISPGKAVGYHFIPFFNIFWVFKWLTEFTKFIGAQKDINIFPGWIVALLVIGSLFLESIVDIGIFLIVVFGVEVFLFKNLAKLLY